MIFLSAASSKRLNRPRRPRAKDSKGTDDGTWPPHLRRPRPRDRPGTAAAQPPRGDRASRPGRPRDRKSTRLNSSHANISYAVFCLKKKKNNTLFPLLVHTASVCLVITL